MEIYSGTFDLVIIMFYFAGNEPHLIATFRYFNETSQNIAKGLFIIVLCIHGGGAINFVVEKIKR